MPCNGKGENQGGRRSHPAHSFFGRTAIAHILLLLVRTGQVSLGARTHILWGVLKSIFCSRVRVDACVWGGVGVFLCGW